MADFLWSFAVDEVLKKTVKLVAEQIGMSWGFKKDLSKLRDSLLMVEAILRDVNRIKAEHQALRLWVEKLEHIVFEADVLLDELSYEDLRRKVDARPVRSFVSSSKNPLVFRLKMANKIKAIAKRLDEHYCAASIMGLVAITSKEVESEPSQILETDSFLDEIGVIGREAEVLEIVNKLLELSKQEAALSVLPIVGIGGLGKTSLAKAIFHHEMIRENFDRMIWVCVSEPFVINKILRAILETLNANFGGLDNKEALLQELQKLLRNKKYFLVLDDVWNENPDLWNELRACLLKANKKFGSVIVVTTRSDEVANIVETNHQRHRLRKLSNDYCWTLFEKCAFGSDLPVTPRVDHVIREELVKRFGGIPLVVKVFGGMVKLDKNKCCQGLRSTLENLIISPLQYENSILSTIKLSVDRLPSSSLKQCFAYCSNFPRGFLFIREPLVQMWIAQGFIHLPSGSNVTMEDIGANYFNTLLSRSLFQDVVKDDRERILYCKMHDVVHDVACAISNAQKLRLSGKSNGDKALSIGHEIRTLHCSENVVERFHLPTFDSHVFHNEISNFTYLCVLIIHSWFIHQLPDSIAKLKHLRYLDISHSLIRTLPDSIVSLYNLQTLRLGSKIMHLPTKLRKLVNLRHLEFSLSTQTKQMPQHLSRLLQLQTLSSFVVGFDKGCKIEELGPLNNLKGELSLFHLEHVKSKTEAMAANLAMKENISDLYFQWSLLSEREDCSNNDLNVLEGLRPHKNLQALKIENFGGVLPNGLFVENLVEVILYDCKRCETLPMLGHLSKLELLHIRCLDSVKSIGDEFYGNNNSYHNEWSSLLFPKLKTLHISQMKSLELWQEIGSSSNYGATFPHLESLSIVWCSKLMNIPNLFQVPPKLQSLKIFYCEKLTKLPHWLNLCSSIENMVICNCPNVNNNSLPNLKSMPNLSSLSIQAFEKLPEGLATIHNLKRLDVYGELQGLDWSPFMYLNSSIEILRLVNTGVSNLLLQLPRQLEYLTALRSLDIERFSDIDSLPEWLGNLTSLETLNLRYCKNLKSFPSIEAMSNLTKLSRLETYECFQLKLDEGSYERAKIAHVHDISC
ncbi:putative disease resistance protein RGA3 [Cucumis sativus]|uniref:Disease resistance protein RGA3 n=1 Tax=Cucumis sativus TaxID=3659 RepID=A0A0A0KTZ7_CUCSA|nr:putative disease resistance protein RGA3 [Cucumis sativus]KGN53095.1 hypothetical protein Csa_015377 [Cucumis sativus]